MATASLEIGRLGVAPGCAEDHFVGECKDNDDDDTEGVLEEVLGSPAKATLVRNY